MRNVRRLGLVLVAVCAFGALAVSSATAHPEFLSSAVGGQLTGKLIQTQVFNTKFGNVECTALTVSGETIALRSLEQHVTVHYSKCTAFGVTATITPALYLFLSLNAVHVVRPITVTASGCTLTVKPQTVGAILYSSKGTELIITPEVTNIAYEGVGSLCSGSAKTGTYKGQSLLSLPGGEVSWME